MKNCIPVEEKSVKPMYKLKFLPWTVGLLGILACLLRGSLYAFFTDARNLLPESHPAQIALWVLTAAVLLVILPAFRMVSPEGSGRFFGRSMAAALGHILLAAGILLTVAGYPPAMAGPLGQLWKLLGVVSAPLLVYGGFSRALGKRPSFLSYVAVSVFFALHLVCHYRAWCSDPQLQNYVFAFTGSLGLMMFSYYQGAACVGLGNCRLQLLSGLLSVYLCLASLPACRYAFLYLTGALWALTSLCPAEGVLSRHEKAGDSRETS